MIGLETVVPLVMGCALLWWIGRGLSTRSQLLIAVVTLALIVLVLTVERLLRP